MSEYLKFILLVTILILIAMLAFPPTRELLKALGGSYLKPGVAKAAISLSVWLLWLMKTIYQAHWILLRNLISPRSSIYPTLAKKYDPDKGG